MKKRYYYVYIIVNLINGKYYGGAHSTNDLYDGYMGSGVILKSAIKKYGIEYFVKEIVRYFDTEEEMYAYEAEMVNQEWVDDPMCYNVALGGVGHSHTEKTKQKMSASRIGHPGWTKGRKDSEETRRKKSEALKGRPRPEEVREKISKSSMGKTIPDAQRQKISDSLKGNIPWNKGIPVTEEARRRMSEAKKGKHWRLDPETNKRVYY